MSDDIVVIGRRPRQVIEYADRISNFIPVAASVRVVDWITGETGERIAQVYELDAVGNKIFRFEEFGFEIRIPETDWNKFTPNEQRAIVYMLQNYHLSPTFTAALQHLHNERVPFIEIRKDNVKHLVDGSTQQFGNTPTGQPENAAIDWIVDRSSTDTREIAPNTKVVITLRNVPKSLHEFTKDFIHEFLHPVTPEAILPDGTPNDS